LSALLCQLVWNGARVLEIPLTFGVRGHGKSKLSLRDQAEFLGRVGQIFLLRRRYRDARVSPAMRTKQVNDVELEVEQSLPIKEETR
jgi:hypothetical protein